MSSAVGARWRGAGFSASSVAVSDDDDDDEGRPAGVGSLDGLAKSRVMGNCMPSVAMVGSVRPRGLECEVENRSDEDVQ